MNNKSYNELAKICKEKGIKVIREDSKQSLLEKLKRYDDYKQVEQAIEKQENLDSFIPSDEIQQKILEQKKTIKRNKNKYKELFALKRVIVREVGKQIHYENETKLNRCEFVTIGNTEVEHRHYRVLIGKAWFLPYWVIKQLKQVKVPIYDENGTFIEWGQKWNIEELPMPTTSQIEELKRLQTMLNMK